MLFLSNTQFEELSNNINKSLTDKYSMPLSTRKLNEFTANALGFDDYNTYLGMSKVRNDPTNAVMTISADVHTDDHRVKINFDAVHWFEQAADEAILDLYECQWGGNYASDRVAEESAQWFEHINDVFNHDSHNNDLNGFECHVDEDDALKWLNEHRPNLYYKIIAKENDITEFQAALFNDNLAWWTDPDDDTCSQVVSIVSVSDTFPVERTPDTLASMKNTAGDVFEGCLCELSPINTKKDDADNIPTNVEYDALSIAKCADMCRVHEGYISNLYWVMIKDNINNDPDETAIILEPSGSDGEDILFTLKEVQALIVPAGKSNIATSADNEITYEFLSLNEAGQD